MTTNKTVLTTQEVAARFNKLFSDNVRGLEPTNSPHVKHEEGKSFVQKKGGELMRKIQTIAVIVGLLFSSVASSQNKQTPGAVNKIEPLPRDWKCNWRSVSCPASPRQCNCICFKP